MANNIVAALGVLVIVAGPCWLLYLAFMGLRDIRRMIRKAPKVDASIAHNISLIAQLRRDIGDLKRENEALDRRLASVEAWAKRVGGKK